MEYIPLETTKASLFGTVMQLVITDSSIIVSDFDTQSIIFFSEKGKFLKKIKLNEHAYPSLIYDNQNKLVIIVTYDVVIGKMGKLYCNMVGGLIKTPPSIVQTSNIQGMIILGDNYFASANNCYLSEGQNPTDTVCYLLDIYNRLLLHKSFFPIVQKQNPIFCALGGGLNLKNNIVKNGTFYVSTPYDYFLYKINKDTAQKIYQLLFPQQRMLSPKILNSPNPSWHYIDSVKASVQKSNNLIVDVSNIFFNNHKLFFKINTISYSNYQGSEDNNQFNLIFDTVTSRLVSLERISPDFATQFLPFSGNSLSSKRDGFIYNSNFIYSTVSSLQMFTAKEATKSKNPQYPPVLEEYFKTQNRKSNPVIVRMKLKE